MKIIFNALLTHWFPMHPFPSPWKRVEKGCIGKEWVDIRVQEKTNVNCLLASSIFLRFWRFLSFQLWLQALDFFCQFLAAILKFQETRSLLDKSLLLSNHKFLSTSLRIQMSWHWRFKLLGCNSGRLEP